MRRSKGYQDLDDGNETTPRETTARSAAPLPPVQDIEMATVSVVPDGVYNKPLYYHIVFRQTIQRPLTYNLKYNKYNECNSNFRYIYCNTSCKFSWFWMVSS